MTEPTTTVSLGTSAAKAMGVFVRFLRGGGAARWSSRPCAAGSLWADGFSNSVSTVGLRCARSAALWRVHQTHQPPDDVHRYTHVYCSFDPNEP